MTTETPAPAKGGKKFVILLILFAVFAVGAGAALPWVLGDSLGDLMPKAKKSEPPKSKQAAIAFDDVVVNLGEEKFNRFLRVKLMVAVDEVDVREVTELMTQKKAFLKSWLICHLSDQSPQDVTRRTSVNRIRREICDQFNQMLFENSEGKIVDILFDMFVVQ